jgi:hypothetical protein
MILHYVIHELSGARSFISAPEITLPIKLKGWYSVSIGLWNPHLFYDGTPIVKVRLKSDPVFRQIHPGASPDTQDTTFLEEVFLFDAEMTDDDLVIAKSNGLIPRMAYVAYFKFVPLTADQIKKKQQAVSSRNMTATIDGSSLFHYSECSTVNQFLERLAPYRDSDVEKVLWAVNYGDETNFPTDVKEASFIGDDPYYSLLKPPLGNDYLRGQKQMH